MRRLLLLGATAFCLCVFVAADAQLDKQGVKPLPEKDGVLQLNKGNFNRALRKYEQLLVHFCKSCTEARAASSQPTCLHGKKKQHSLRAASYVSLEQDNHLTMQHAHCNCVCSFPFA